MALTLLLSGACMGLFIAPDRAAVMNSPASDRGAGGGTNQTFPYTPIGTLVTIEQ